MIICAYAGCLEVVDESDWHLEVVGLGVMHLDCHKSYLLVESVCVWCHKFVDVASKNAVSYKNRFYHASCLDEESLSRQGIQVQLALNF